METEGGEMWQKLEIRFGHPSSLRPGPLGRGGGEGGQHHHQQQHRPQHKRARKGPARLRRDAERAAAHRQTVQTQLKDQQVEQEHVLSVGGEPPNDKKHIDECESAVAAASSRTVILELEKAPVLEEDIFLPIEQIDGNTSCLSDETETNKSYDEFKQIEEKGINEKDKKGTF